MFESKKVLKLAEAAEKSIRLRNAGLTIAFTNGCFDILHPGHIYSLKMAKNMADILFVGINSDSSIKKIKDERRPVFPLKQRIIMLESLSYVNYIVPFDENTPLEIIQAVLPDVLVKGGDYSKAEIVGKDIVESAGGKVVTVPLLEGFSTSSLIKKINSLFPDYGL